MKIKIEIYNYYNLLNYNKYKMIKNQRYFFITNKNLTNRSNFRATFVEIINNTLIIKLFNNESHERNGLMSIPLIWIERTETLDDITLQELPLPKDIVNIIDLYL